MLAKPRGQLRLRMLGMIGWTAPSLRHGRGRQCRYRQVQDTKPHDTLRHHEQLCPPGRVRATICCGSTIRYNYLVINTDALLILADLVGLDTDSQVVS
jgi:hypothetical protein